MNILHGYKLVRLAYSIFFPFFLRVQLKLPDDFDTIQCKKVKFFQGMQHIIEGEQSY